MQSLTASVLMEAGNWDSLNVEEWAKMSDEDREKLLAVADLFRATFESDAGRQVLEYFINTYYVTERIVNAGDDQFGPGTRQGHVDVVRLIFKMLALAHSGGERRD